MKHYTHNIWQLEATETMWKRYFREIALNEQGGKCCYCKEPITHEQATADHVKPRKNGGLTHGNNIKAACEPCNNAKGSMSEKHFKRAIRRPAHDAPLGIWMAHFRFRLWTRLDKAQKRVRAFVGIDGGMR